jgi:hypothetical protein
MKTSLKISRAMAMGAMLLGMAAVAQADVYGVRGPRGAAVVGEDRAAAVTRRGVAVSGPNGTAVARRPVAPAPVVVAPRPVAVAPRPVVVAPAPVVVAPRPVVVAPAPVVVAAPLPAGYVRVVPAGYRTVVYRGYNCRYVGGVYYRPVMYQGSAAYVVVR